MQKDLSPFSSLNNYEITVKPKPLKDAKYLTPRDIIVMNILKSCGAAAGFQLECLWPMNGRRMLKKMADIGLIMRTRLEGKSYKLNVYSLAPQGVGVLLRGMAFCQLYLRMREADPCSAALLPWPLTGVLKFNGVLFGVLAVRAGDGIDPVWFRGIDRLIIIAEAITPEVLHLPFPYRLTTDRALLDDPLEAAFFKPDGSPEIILRKVLAS